MRVLHNHRGMTLAELLVSSAVFSLLTAGFVLSYKSSYSSFVQGSEKTMAMRSLREASNKIQPLISSACPVPKNDGTFDPAILFPVFVSAPGTTAQSVRFTTLKEYSDINILRLSAPTQLFNPVDSSTSQYQEVRVFFNPTSGDANVIPGGQVGHVRVDLNTASTADDRIVARNLYDCSFTNVGSNSLILRLELRRFIRRNMGLRTVQSYTLETRLFIPYYTNTAGGGG